MRKYKELANQAEEKVKQFKIKLVKEVEDKRRLHQLKYKNCLEAYKLCKKAKILQEKLDNLAYNDKTPDHDAIVNSDDKDNSQSQPYTFWQSTSTITKSVYTSFEVSNFCKYNRNFRSSWK